MARWDGIYEFVEVVKCGGFRPAATRLGMSTSQVSKLVSKLEARLGVQLMVRTTRRMRLTSEGEQFFRQCEQTIVDFESAEDLLVSQQKDAKGTLRINLAGHFHEPFIVPVLARFMEENPKIDLDVEFTDTNIDLIDGGYDLAFWHGELDDVGMVTTPIADKYMHLCASPDYLKEHGTPKTVEELKDHQCLLYKSANWQLSDGKETVQVKVSGRWRCNSLAAQLSAVRAGVGIALLPYFSLHEDFRAGSLLHVLPDWSEFSSPVWLVYPRGRHQSARLKKFVAFMTDFGDKKPWENQRDS